MGLRLRVRIEFVVALLTAFLCAASANAQTRVALVFGNSAYRHVPVLPNPTNDATDIAASLQRLGFSVRRVDNGSFEDMRRALLEFGPRARQAEMAVVFFAGHGMEVGGENWLIPIDAELKTDVDTEHEAIALKSVLLMVSSASKLGLVVLDACRNNPFAARMLRTVRTRAVDRGLTRIEPTGSVLVAYAAKDGTTAADGSGRNSPFTTALLSHLETPGLEINFLFRNVRDDVLRATKRGQEPFVYGSLSKEAIFLKPPPATPPTPGLDNLTWSFLQDTTDIAALKRFIAEYPKSPLVRQAEMRIASLLAAEATSKLASVQPDQRELVRSLQLELRRVGCFEGAINGEFGDTTRAALRRFTELAALGPPSGDLSLDVLRAVRGIDKRICPLVCPLGESADGERCVRIVCPAGYVLKDGTCLTERVETMPKGKAGQKTAPTVQKDNPRCFTFQGRRFCE